MPIEHIGTGSSLRLDIREAGPESWSEIRNLHATSFRTLTGPHLDPPEVVAFLERIYSPDYTDLLQISDIVCAVYERRIIATAGWMPVDDAGSSVRITAVFTDPLFQRLGVGRCIVAAAETRARAGGFQALNARVFSPALAFFERLDYRRSSQGAFSVGTENGIPITFMRKVMEPRARRNGEMHTSEDGASCPDALTGRRT